MKILTAILREAFPSWSENLALFDLFNNPPWGEEVEPALLNLEYFGNHSGLKFVSPLVVSMLSTEQEGLSLAQRTNLANLILSKYKRNWAHLWQTVVVEYSPINNYDMTETRDLTTTEDETRVTDGELNRSGTNSTAVSGTDTSTESIWGLNSGVNPKPSEKTDATMSRTETETRNTKDTNDVTNTLDNDGTEHEVTHRIGNIGVTTNQKLISEERELRIWNFFEQVYKDIDEVLTIQFYDPCVVDEIYRKEV